MVSDRQTLAEKESKQCWKKRKKGKRREREIFFHTDKDKTQTQREKLMWRKNILVEYSVVFRLFVLEIADKIIMATKKLVKVFACLILFTESWKIAEYSLEKQQKHHNQAIPYANICAWLTNKTMERIKNNENKPVEKLDRESTR